MTENRNAEQAAGKTELQDTTHLGERLPQWLDEFMPFHGPCAFCGSPDARHRVIDSACENVRAGDSLEVVAANYELPAHVIARALTEELDVW